MKRGTIGIGVGVLMLGLGLGAAPQSWAGNRVNRVKVDPAKAKFVGPFMKAKHQPKPPTSASLQATLSKRAKLKNTLPAPKKATKAKPQRLIPRSLLKQRREIRKFREKFRTPRKQVMADMAADSHLQEVMSHSETSGEYYIVSDLHWGVGRARNDGPWDPAEDFRRGDSFSKFIGKTTAEQRNTTLIIGGDWLEMIEHVDHTASPAEVNRTVTKIIEGHAQEIKALARAVDERGLRVIYNAGNHDVHLVDVGVRKHLVNEMARVGGLSGERAKRFASRVAYTGHGALLGRYGEGIVLHGHAQDPANNWRANVNPYNAKRELQKNFGWDMVSIIHRNLEKNAPDVDNGKDATRSVALRVLTRPKYFVLAARALWEVFGQKNYVGRAGQTSEKLDDRGTMRDWVKRSGLAAKMATPIPGAQARNLNASEWAKEMEQIYKKMPKPLHERMRTPLRTLNILGALIGLPRLKAKLRRADSTILGDLSARLPNVRYIVWGHTHSEGVAVGSSAKGELAHYNSGSWTKVNQEWRLNVVHGSTDGAGRLTMHGLKRTNPVTGEANLPHEASAKNRPIPGWGEP